MNLYSRMLVELDPKEVPGEYDEEAQTWSEVVDAQSSPQKHHQEN